ncbi:hypothetical protein Q4553_03735 [Tenacibaculum soleae]|uniref:hypothetical protein n=1 Tax=Tenacibaculum soleae TaxID=447689 RepID=UPI0026E44EA2|nr:hypothetical protein [Tenacibaculum soleae]MDO6743670.1 hypothetical protein [Tenacibaculum soleae]
MKKHIITLIFILNTFFIFGQVLPGTLSVTGQPFIIESTFELPTEAGDGQSGIASESGINGQEISFVLNPTLLGPIPTTSEQNCTANVYLYKVFMHTEAIPNGVLIEARASTGGTAVPALSPYDILNIPFGPRAVTLENGGAYITLPDDGSQAIKVFEFVGCRENVPVQFRVKAKSKVSTDLISNVNIFYTITATIN